MVTVEFIKSGSKCAQELIPTLLKVGEIAINELFKPEDSARVKVRFKKLPKNTHAIVEPMKTSGRYQIFLNKDLSFKMQALFLCHELVHIKQFVTGELVLSNDKTETTWSSNGVTSVYSATEIENGISDSGFEYYKQLPWESEAYSKSDALMSICKEKLKGERIDLGAGFLIPLF